MKNAMQMIRSFFSFLVTLYFVFISLVFMSAVAYAASCAYYDNNWDLAKELCPFAVMICMNCLLTVLCTGILALLSILVKAMVTNRYRAVHVNEKARITTFWTTWTTGFGWSWVIGVYVLVALLLVYLCYKEHERALNALDATTIEFFFSLDGTCAANAFGTTVPLDVVALWPGIQILIRIHVIHVFGRFVILLLLCPGSVKAKVADMCQWYVDGVEKNNFQLFIPGILAAIGGYVAVAVAAAPQLLPQDAVLLQQYYVMVGYPAFENNLTYIKYRMCSGDFDLELMTDPVTRVVTNDLLMHHCRTTYKTLIKEKGLLEQLRIFDDNLDDAFFDDTRDNVSAWLAYMKEKFAEAKDL